MNKQLDLLYVPTPARQRRLVREMPERERPLHRLQQAGAQAISATELLAVILNTPDAYDLAQDILHSTGSLQNLARKTKSELMAFGGIGETLAGRIRAALELGRRMSFEPEQTKTRVSSPGDCYNYLYPHLMNLEQEHLVVMCLDTRNNVIGHHHLYIGSLNTSVIRIGEIFRVAIRENAAAIIVAHNHPSGDPSPSPEDIRVTRQIVQSGQALDITVLDHIIIGHNRYVSLKEKGAGFD